MSEYITLLGAEGVQKAGYNMQSAASEMLRAAAQITEALRLHERFMQEYLQEFQEALKK